MRCSCQKEGNEYAETFVDFASFEESILEFKLYLWVLFTYSFPIHINVSRKMNSRDFYRWFVKTQVKRGELEMNGTL